MLLRAAHLSEVQFLEPGFGTTMRTGFGIEYDRVYNMRDNRTGLNVDFMSYASYAQANYDPTALLDPEILLNKSQKIFSAFFQHFVNNDISQENGSWAYQSIDSELEIAPPLKGMPASFLPNGEVAPRFEDIPQRNTSRTAVGTLSTRIEVLRMNLVAFWISTSILAWLTVTLIVFIALQRRYLGGMMRNVECIADVLILISSSERLMGVIKEKGIDTILEDDQILTRLGWFKDPDGTMKWRIELTEDEQMQLRPISLGTAYAPVPEEDEGDEHRVALSDGGIPRQSRQG